VKDVILFGKIPNYQNCPAGLATLILLGSKVAACQLSQGPKANFPISFLVQLSLCVLEGLSPALSKDTKIRRLLTPLYKIV
jgi:hypothetical protein